jgi:hypothetical protein
MTARNDAEHGDTRQAAGAACLSNKPLCLPIGNHQFPPTSSRELRPPQSRLFGSTDPLFLATAKSAVEAVMHCVPYDFLPADKYDVLRDITINFNPNLPN